jgi:hypothetical protein
MTVIRDEDFQATDMDISRDNQRESVKIGKQRSQEVHECLFEFLDGCGLRPLVARIKI